MNIISFIESLESVGVPPEKILAALKEQHKKQQEATRLRVKKHRNNNKPVTHVTDVTDVTQSSVTRVTPPPSSFPLSPPLLPSPTPPSEYPPIIPQSSPPAQPRAQDSPFKKIFDAGSAVFPSLAVANTSSIQQWIAAGCSPELDAIPEIQRLARAGKAVKAWSYFTGGIMDAKATREQPLQPGNSKGAHYDNATSRQPIVARSKTTETLEAIYRAGDRVRARRGMEPDKARGDDLAIPSSAPAIGDGT